MPVADVVIVDSLKWEWLGWLGRKRERSLKKRKKRMKHRKETERVRFRARFKQEAAEMYKCRDLIAVGVDGRRKGKEVHMGYARAH